MKIKMIATFAMVLMMAMTSIIVNNADSEEVPSSGPFWVEPRDFFGYVGNLTPANRGSINLSQVISISAKDTSIPPKDLGPWIALAPNASSDNDWDPGTLRFHVEVDIQNMDTNIPFELRLFDRYEWNETGNGLISLPVPSNFTDAVPSPYDIPNGTIEYIPGVFGDLSITIFNGSSGEPLEGVGFNFPKHPPRSSTESSLYTNETGYVLFEDMQMGVDNIQNNITININKEHFNTESGTGTIKRVIKEGRLVHYNITLVEDDLVKSFSPAPDSTNVVANKSKTNILIQFHEEMQESSVNANTVWVEEKGGDKIGLRYDWNPSGDLVKLVPEQDLKFNTSYDLFVTPRVKNDAGTEILWRTFSSSFTTQLKPARISGTVLINGTMDIAPEGSSFILDSNAPVFLDSGTFDLSVSEDDEHRIEVFGPTVGDVDEYMYTGQGVQETFTLERGEELVIDTLKLYKQPVRTVRFNVKGGNGEVLAGATLTNLITDEEFQTDKNGTVDVGDIRRDISTPFNVEYPNYDGSSFSVTATDEDLTVWNVTLFEDQLPIIIKVRGRESEIDLTRDSVVDVDSSIIMTFEANMEIETMSVDNIQILKDGITPVIVDIFNETGTFRKWFVEPRSDLEYNTDYTMVVKGEVSTSLGANPLWRDVSIPFVTEGLSPAAVNGFVKVGDKPVAGIDITISWGGMIRETDITDSSGFFLIDLDMNMPEVTGVSIIANGSDFGLNTVTIEDRVLRAGGSLEAADILLERLPGVFSIDYPEDELGRMQVGGSITIKFSQELEHTDLASFMENFTLRSSSSEDLGIEVLDDNKTVILTPVKDLQFDTDYTLDISNFQDGEFDRELLTTTGIPALIRGEVVEIKTEFAPIEVLVQSPSEDDLDNVELDVEIVIYFTNYMIDPSKLESKIQIVEFETSEPVGNLTFDWATSGKQVTIMHHEFDVITKYSIIIPKGVYGFNGERIKEDFLLEFTTLNKLDRSVIIDQNLPATAAPDLLTISVENPVAKPLNVKIYIKREEGDTEYRLLKEFQLGILEERQVDLDLSDMDTGAVTLLFNITHTTKGHLVNEYTRSLVISEESNPDEGGLELWMIILIIVFVVVIAFLGVFLYTQTRKKDIEEELKEEFECPECHNLVGSDDTVCPSCGAEFEEEAYKCPKCGNMLDPEDDECGECGYDFSDQDQMELDEDDFELDDDEEEDMELEEDEELEEEEEFEEFDEEEFEEMEEEEDD